MEIFSLRACGATIANRTDELQESDVGTGAGLFEIKKIGDEYVTSRSHSNLLSFTLMSLQFLNLFQVFLFHNRM
jgi:hypothetical protein